MIRQRIRQNRRDKRPWRHSVRRRSSTAVEMHCLNTFCKSRNSHTEHQQNAAARTTLEVFPPFLPIRADTINGKPIAVPIITGNPIMPTPIENPVMYNCKYSVIMSMCQAPSFKKVPCHPGTQSKDRGHRARPAPNPFQMIKRIAMSWKQFFLHQLLITD